MLEEDTVAETDPGIHPDLRFWELLREPQVVAQILPANGEYPNNPKLPMLAYAGALHLAAGDPALIEALFRANGWGNAWRDGVYGYHHYHSLAHEALGASLGLRVVGACPRGQSPEIGWGRAVERPAADERVAQVALPGADPVYGERGPLMRRWG